MKILGVTGTSGSGKSTFSKILNERDDVKVVDADQVSKDLSVPGTDYLQDVVNAFGQEILKEDGNLNRRALAHIIYNDEKEREKLNSITFPHITREIYERIKAFADPKIKYAVGAYSAVWPLFVAFMVLIKAGTILPEETKHAIPNRIGMYYSENCDFRGSARATLNFTKEKQDSNSALCCCSQSIIV